MVQWLLDAGADINVQPRSDNSALHRAITTGSRELLKILLARKPDLEIKDNHDFTPLMAALSKPDLPAAEMLLQAGANPNAVQQENLNGGFTPLSHVVAHRQPKALALLLEYKADPNLRVGNESPPLVAAIRGSEGPPSPGVANPTLARRIIRGSQGSKRSENEEWNEMVDLLRKYGADENVGRANYISFKRSGGMAPVQWFSRDPDGHNVISLFYLLANLYQGWGAAEAEGNDRWGRPEFPDFSKVVIARLIDGQPERIPVDVASAFASKDCSKNVELHWGDVVEIPEADHLLNEQWKGLSDEARQALVECTTLHVQIRIQTVYHNLVLAPWQSKRVIDQVVYLPYTRLSKVLGNSGLLRASSDPSRVEVQRKTNNQTETMYFDLRNMRNVDPATDLVLKDLDLIVVPEK